MRGTPRVTRTASAAPTPQLPSPPACAQPSRRSPACCSACGSSSGRAVTAIRVHWLPPAASPLLAAPAATPLPEGRAPGQVSLCLRERIIHVVIALEVACLPGQAVYVHVRHLRTWAAATQALTPFAPQAGCLTPPHTAAAAPTPFARLVARPVWPASGWRLRSAPPACCPRAAPAATGPPPPLSSALRSVGPHATG